MKHIFTLVLLLVGIACNAQEYMDKLNKLSKETIKPGDTINFSFSEGLTIASTYLTQKNNDTLFVDLAKYKFIKLGDRVYKINSPTLTEVKESGIIPWPSNFLSTPSTNLNDKKILLKSKN